MNFGQIRSEVGGVANQKPEHPTIQKRSLTSCWADSLPMATSACMLVTQRDVYSIP